MKIDEEIHTVLVNLEDITRQARQTELKQETINKILEITKTMTDAPCLEVTPSECEKFCHKCIDNHTDHGKTCMQYALYKIKKLCEAHSGQ